MTLTQGHISRVKVIVNTYPNPCPVNSFSLPCWIWIIFYTIVVHDPRACHDLDPRSYLQIKVTVHIYWKSVSRPKFLTAMLDLDYISHNCCSRPEGVSWPWPKVISPRSRSQCTYTENPCPGHNSSLPCWILIIYHKIASWPWLMVISPKSRSQFTHWKNLFLDHNLSRVTWTGMIFHTIVVHDPGVVVAGGICPVRACLVIDIWSMHNPYPDFCMKPYNLDGDLTLVYKTYYHMFLGLLSEISLFHKLIYDIAQGSILTGWNVAVRLRRHR